MGSIQRIAAIGAVAAGTTGLAAIPVWMSPAQSRLGLPNTRGSQKTAPGAPVDTIRRTASDALRSLEETVDAAPQ